MTFGSFFEVYEADKKQRVKESTWETKSHVIRTKILPYFENRKSAEIEAKDVIAWQNELMACRDEKGKAYSADYLRTIHAQFTAIFNHAVNFYNLPYNPARRANIQVQEIQRTPQRYYTRRATPRNIIVRFTRVEMKDKMLRAAREKGRVIHKGKPIRLTVDLLAETLQDRREWWANIQHP